MDNDDTKYAFWSAVLWVTHWAFAVTVLHDTAQSEGWLVPVHLTFSAWVSCDKLLANCDQANLIVPVYSPLRTSAMTPGVLAGMFSIVSGANHALTALFFSSNRFPQGRRWVEGEGVGPNALRSLDWGVSAALMMVVNLFLYSAPADFTLVTGYAILTALVMVVGYCIEQQQATRAGTGQTWTLAAVGGPFWVVSMLYGLSWMPLLMIFPGAALDPNHYSRFFANGTAYDLPTNSPPDEVVVFIVWLLGTFCLFPVALGWRLGFPQLTKETYRAGEYIFMVLSAVAKLPLLLLFYSGVAGRRNTTLDPSELKTREKFNFAPFAIGIGVAFALAAAIRMTTRKRKTDSDKEETLLGLMGTDN